MRRALASLRHFTADGKSEMVTRPDLKWQLPERYAYVFPPSNLREKIQ